VHQGKTDLCADDRKALPQFHAPRVGGAPVGNSEEQFPEIMEMQPELVARHCAEAGFIQKAVGYRLVAAAGDRRGSDDGGC
jgi:hypothetical protein